MNSRHDSRRAGQDGTQRIGHDPRRGASSPQWNREAQMQHEQFERRHGSPYESPYANPYGGQYGGYENNLEPRHHSQAGGRHRHPDEDAFREDWYSAEGAMEAGGGRHEHEFGGYGDFEVERRRFDDRMGAPQRRGQVPNQFSRDHGQDNGRDMSQRGGSAAQGRRYDPDYEQWRNEQMRQLDEDFEAYRRERYGKFAEDFNAWRARRTSAQADGGSDTTGKPGNKQQG